MKTVIIIQARIGSSRLPGKVLTSINGKPMLWFQLSNLSRSKYSKEIIVATTTKSADRRIVEFCQINNIKCFRGSEDDVLERYYQAACEHKADIVCRLTADCPLIDPLVVDQIIDRYVENRQKVDYVSNTIERTYPRGMDCEVFSMDALTESYETAREPFEREHVTPFIYRHPELFRILQVLNPEDLSRYRLTVDTQEDFELIRKMLSIVSESSVEKCIEVLKENPDWFLINQHITQKKE